MGCDDIDFQREIIDVLEAHGWNVKLEDNIIYFNTTSPRGLLMRYSILATSAPNAIKSLYYLQVDFNANTYVEDWIHAKQKNIDTHLTVKELVEEADYIQKALTKAYVLVKCHFDEKTKN